MSRRRAIYSLLMVTIYVVATLLSSLSLLLCDEHHHHHHHHAQCSAGCCCCEAGDVISADCCDHHHPILGDNHTDYISSSQRSDSRASQAVALMLLPVVVDNVSNEQALHLAETTLYRECRSVALPDAQTISFAGLRAPPCLA